MPTTRFITTNVSTGAFTQVVPLTASAGTGSSGNLIALNSNGTIDTTMLPAFSGDISTTAGSASTTLANVTVAKGGTGKTSLTAHGVLIGNGTTAINVTTAGTSGQILTSNGSSSDPTFQNNTNSGGSASRRAVADTATTTSTTDYLVAYTSLTATRAVTLASASSVSGQLFIIKDESGSASSYPITITGTIDGATNKSIATAYGVLRFYSNGSSYFTW